MTSDLLHRPTPTAFRQQVSEIFQEKGGEQPLYLAVYGALRKSLLEGAWRVGSSLPSEAALSEQFGVSRITTRHALRLLEADGFVRKARARRTLVVATAPAPRQGWVVESIDDIIARVGNARLEVESWRREESSEAAALFGLPPRTKLFCLRSVLVRDQMPYTRSKIYFPPAVGVRLSRDSFDDPIVFRVLQHKLGIRIEDVRLTIWAELANAEDAVSLGCEVGSAILVMQLVYRDDTGTLVEVAYSRSLASEARVSTRLTTRAPQA